MGYPHLRKTPYMNLDISKTINDKTSFWVIQPWAPDFWALKTSPLVKSAATLTSLTTGYSLGTDVNVSASGFVEGFVKVHSMPVHANIQYEPKKITVALNKSRTPSLPANLLVNVPVCLNHVIKSINYCHRGETSAPPVSSVESSAKVVRLPHWLWGPCRSWSHHVHDISTRWRLDWSSSHIWSNMSHQMSLMLVRNFHTWLVVDLPLWKIWKSNGISVPNMEKSKCSKSPARYSLSHFVPTCHLYWIITKEE